MTGGRASRDKGNRAEREAVEILQEYGIGAQRIPLSGSAGGKFVGDITTPVMGIDRTLEVKCRATGFAKIRGWMADHYGVVLRADYAEPLIVLRLSDFANLAIMADKKRVGQ